MQGLAGVRASWGEAAAGLDLPPSPPSEPAFAGSSEEPWAARAARPQRPAVRVRRPAAASAPPLAAQPPAEPAPAQEPQANAQEAAAQPSAAAAPAPAPPPFTFGTPGAGLAGSAAKARRSRGRTPGPAPSPAFTSSSTASMAWSPYPASSSAEASTASGGAATPAPPGSATPTSGPAPAAPPSPGAGVAADLRARLNLGATPPPASAAGGSAAAADGGGGRAAPPGLEERLREQLNLRGQRGADEPAPEAAAAAPAPAPGPPTAGVARGAEAPPAGFCFVFGAAVPSPAAARAGIRRTKSPGGSPAAAHAARRPPSAASSRPSSASPSAGSAAASASASPRAAAWPTSGGAAAAPADSQATTAAGPAAAAQPAPAAAGGGFVFGAASGSPAALRARHRARSASRSPQQEQRGQQEQQRGAAWAAAMAAAAPAAAAAPEPLREQQAQQPPAGAPQQAAAGFVRLADFGKQSPTSPRFSTAGGTARRAQRRKSTPTRGKPPAAAAQAPVPLSPGAGLVPPAAAAAAPPGPASGSAPSLDAAQQAAYTKCEMYRSQGNEAFRDGDYPTAFDLYSKALQALWPHPPLHPRLALLLSNRAAALLSQGKPLSALADCRMGLKYDAALMRCALRVATCHSRMGDFDEAFAFVAKLREQAAGNEEQLRDIAAKQRDLEEQERQMYDAMRSLGHALQAPQRDAATGAPLERAASGGSNLSRAPSGSSLSRASSGPAPAVPSTAEAFWAALKKVDDVAPHVPHSELLLAAKAEGLVRLGKHRRAREFCEQPVHMDDGPHQAAQKRAPWRLWLQAQCSWHEGDIGGDLKRQLEALLAALEAEAAQAGGSGAPSSAGGASGAAAAPSAFFPAAPAAGQTQEQRRRAELGELVGLPSAADVRQLLGSLEAADKLRLAGNAAIKAGKAAEAVQKYTEALAAGGLSPAIASVLLSNRAAAHQHLKQHAQAVADCCRAVALNPSYAKAHSRLATLLAELGYHSDAASALEAALASSGLPSPDKRGYQQRLREERAAASRATSRASTFGGAPIDHYKLLGLERGVAADEVRKAYKKLALQLHPDKSTSACRVAARCCGCGSPAFEAAAAQARLSERATWLFKLLGEANEVLSDPAKRRSLDASLAMARGGRAGFSSRYGDSDDDSDAFFAGDPFFGGGFGRYGGSSRGAGGFGSGAYGGGAYGGFGGFGGGSYGAGYGTYGAGTGFGGSSGAGAGARRAGGAGGFGGSRYWGYG